MPYRAMWRYAMLSHCEEDKLNKITSDSESFCCASEEVQKVILLHTQDKTRQEERGAEHLYPNS